MTVGVTWDVDLARRWGEAMGKEFYDKGANVQLGPGLCLARVPKCGRNFEYISGADPFLGYTMVQPVVKGIQSQNVIANAKHYALNNQVRPRSRLDGWDAGRCPGAGVRVIIGGAVTPRVRRVTCCPGAEHRAPS